jgi:DNA-binding transcriptional MerR regulator
MKRGGGRRYYRPDDLDLLRGIRHLLYGEGYTIRGVQRLLREQGVRFVQNVWHPDAPHPARQGEAEENDGAETAIAEEVVALSGARDLTGNEGAQIAWNEPSAMAGAMPSAVSAMTSEQVAKLRAALHDLTECRWLLEAALGQRI